jgi:hypothetical protein
MDEDHTRVAWPPHSYENIYFIQERYESVVMSSQMVDQTRSIPTLRHKGPFAYEWSRTPPAVAAPGALALLGHCRSVETDGEGSEAPENVCCVVCSHTSSSATDNDPKEASCLRRPRNSWMT